MTASLVKEIVASINQEQDSIFFDLPYALTKEQIESLENLVDNAPLAYSFEIKESPCYSNGTLLLLVLLE